MTAWRQTELCTFTHAHSLNHRSFHGVLHRDMHSSSLCPQALLQMAQTQNIPRCLSLDFHYIQYARSPSISTHRMMMESKQKSRQRWQRLSLWSGCRPAAFQERLVSLMQNPFLRSVVKWVTAQEKIGQTTRKRCVCVDGCAWMCGLCIWLQKCLNVSVLVFLLCSLLPTKSHSWYTWGLINVLNAFPAPENISKVDFLNILKSSCLLPRISLAYCYVSSRNWGIGCNQCTYS